MSAAHALLLEPRDFVGSAQAKSHAYTLWEAEAYTRWLATHHYENFPVVSFLLPKRLHQDFFNVYAYCRWADDLADEIGNIQKSEELLEWWGVELDRMYAGSASHPVFLALKETVARHSIPKQPFADLIRAFLQDQRVTRYETWEGVLEYCTYSANPVGRLVLYLCGYSDAARQRLSDATCTALQLANFWQDVAVDLKKDRVYIPLEVLRRHGYSLNDLLAMKQAPEFQSALRECVNRARTFFMEGLPLAGMVDRHLSLDLDLFSRGGMAILDKIEKQNCEVLSKRPSIGKIARVSLLVSALVRLATRRAA